MDKRQFAFIKIIAWSVTAVILITVLVLGLTGIWNWTSIGFGGGYFYTDSGKYQTGGAELDGKQIKDLDINWINGNITVEVYDGETVQFFEKSHKDLKESEQLRYYSKDGKLIIQYRKAKRALFSLGTNLRKELTVRIPEKTAETMGYIRIDTISADAKVKAITAERFNLDSTSGNFSLSECKSYTLSMDSTSGNLAGESLYVDDKLDADTTSGDVDVEGSFQYIDSDTVSGTITIMSQICPQKVRTDSVSGDVILTIPENSGFTYRKDSVSGSLECDFDVSQKEDMGIHKDGSASFHFDSVSGDIAILKLGKN